MLGIEASRDEIGIHLSEGKYILDILERFNKSNVSPYPTPMAVGTTLSIKDGDLLANPSLHRSVVGALQYLTKT